MARLAVTLVVMAGLLLAACGTVRTTVATLRALQNAGFTNVSVRLDSTNGFDTVVVRAGGGPAEEPEAKAAQIVWTTFKFSFDQIDSSVRGQRQVFSRGDLEERFGPRPPGSDKDLARDVFRTFVIIAAITVVVLAGVLLLVVLLVRRSRKRRPPPGPPGWYGPPPGGGYGPPPGGGYGPPPSAGYGPPPGGGYGPPPGQPPPPSPPAPGGQQWPPPPPPEGGTPGWQ